MTDKTPPPVDDNVNAPTKKQVTPKPVIAETATNKSSKPAPKKVSRATPSQQKENKSKLSKLALFATFIAICGMAAAGGNYFWQNQQRLLLAEQLNGQTNAALKASQREVHQALQQLTAQVNNNSQEKMAELKNTVAHLAQLVEQQQPSDWLIHEAEYLIRIAARTMWLEQDTIAAIGLLKDADARLTELNDPRFLPVRALIHQDIQSLKSIPILQTEPVVLALMAMNKQVKDLPIAVNDLGKSRDKVADLALTNDAADWKDNLQKTWQKFVDDFISVRRRTDMVEALISPDQQQNLKQNLSLKVQLALWAASEQKVDVYQKALDDIQQWLNEFFDMKQGISQTFYQTVTSLKEQQISFTYANDLVSLSAIRRLLKDSSAQTNNQPQPQVKLALPAAKAVVAPTAKKVAEEVIPKEPIKPEQELELKPADKQGGDSI